MFFEPKGVLFLSGLVLLTAVIDDLRSRKIHNQLILFLLAVVLLSVFLLKGLEGLLTGGFSALLALLVGIPLTLARIIGGGDLKLLFVLAWIWAWPDMLKILIYAFPWALILGIFKVILDGKIKDFAFNTFFLLRHRKTEGLKLHSIPFSVALFMAWLSFLSLQGLSVLGGWK